MRVEPRGARVGSGSAEKVAHMDDDERDRALLALIVAEPDRDP
jgi:hypothetical protein